MLKFEVKAVHVDGQIKFLPVNAAAHQLATVFGRRGLTPESLNQACQWYEAEVILAAGSCAPGAALLGAHMEAAPARPAVGSLPSPARASLQSMVSGWARLTSTFFKALHGEAPVDAQGTGARVQA